ncbi:hypothetical protein ACHQM5_029802 [Ranunculus cassubicifolius]
MAPQSLTDYERKRLENIKRNEQMMASLKVHSKSLELTSTIKRHRTEIKGNKQVKKPKPSNPTVIRRSPRIIEEKTVVTSVKTPFQEAYIGDPSEYRFLIDRIMNISENDDLDKMVVVEKGDSFDLSSMILKQENIMQLMRRQATIMEFFPCSDQSLIVVGNRYGNIVLWDADYEGEESGEVHLFKHHKDQISGISIHSFSLSKVFSSGYDGLLQTLDFEKESLDVVYSSDNAISCLSQQPQDDTSLYFSEAFGMLNVWDTRAGILSSSWKLHDDGINTIEFHPENKNLMATSSADGKVCIWDLRRRPKNLKVVNHETSVRSAFFSPTGSALAISTDYCVNLLNGADFMDESTIYKMDKIKNHTTFSRAIWGWNDSYLFIGNSKRGVDVIYTDGNVAKLEISEFPFIPCRLAAHPYKVGALAAAGGQGSICLLNES